MKTLLSFLSSAAWGIFFFIGKIYAFVAKLFKRKKYTVLFKTPRRDMRANKRYIEELMAKNIGVNNTVVERSAHRVTGKSFLFAVVLLMIGFASCQQEDDMPTPQAAPLIARDTLVKFTLYSKRVPYIWKREVKGVWVQDTIKTNNATKYEPYDTNNYGIGYWVTMNLNGIYTDSLHIIGEYNGRKTEMTSLKGQSAAYVLINAIGPK